ncbi:GNAT family N-acetyltransferase [Candidatus Woesearchaeota archaeon]|nr:GNAT family N-acetyltransferase [Candidatus Woesearchaeota archaeon]
MVTYEAIDNIAGNRSPLDAQLAEAISGVVHSAIGAMDLGNYSAHEREFIASWWPPERIVELSRGSFLVIAREGEELIGSGMIVPEELWQVRMLYVSPEFQRGGVGSNILQRLEDAAMRHGVQAVRLETFLGSPSQVFYEKNGWVASPGCIRHNIGSEVTYRCMAMEKLLP